MGGARCAPPFFCLPFRSRVEAGFGLAGDFRIRLHEAAASSSRSIGERSIRCPVGVQSAPGRCRRHATPSSRPNPSGRAPTSPAKLCPPVRLGRLCRYHPEATISLGPTPPDPVASASNSRGTLALPGLAGLNVCRAGPLSGKAFRIRCPRSLIGWRVSGILPPSVSLAMDGRQARNIMRMSNICRKNRESKQSG